MQNHDRIQRATAPLCATRPGKNGQRFSASKVRGSLHGSQHDKLRSSRAYAHSLMHPVSAPTDPLLAHAISSLRRHAAPQSALQHKSCSKNPTEFRPVTIGRNSRGGSRTRPQPRCTLVLRAMIHTAQPSVSLVHTGNGERWFTARFPQRLEASRKNLDVHHLSARLLSSSLRQADGALRPSPVLSPLGRGMC